MTVENKNPLQQFCSGATSTRYDEFAGETLVNATVIPNITQTSRSPAMLVPRMGRELVIGLTGIKLAWKSYSIDRQIIVRNNEDGVGEIILYNLTPPFYDHVTLLTLDVPVVGRPLAVDTYNSCVISVNDIGYTISSTFEITQIVGGGWTAPSSMCFIDGYVLISKKNSREFLRSELNGTEFTDLINFTVIQAEDNIKNIANINNNLFIFADRHTEVWWNSGASPDQPFTRQDGLTSQYGTISFNTIVIDGIGYNAVKSEIMRGVFSWSPSAQKISVDAVDQALEGADVVMIHTSVENGRRFIHVVIDDTKVWSFDILSQSWHERTNQIAVDYFPGDSFYYFVDSVGIHTIKGNLDNDELITCERRSPHLMSNGKRVFYTMLELDAGGNVGTMKLEYSNDGGKTWLNSNFSTSTQIGKYNRFRFNRLGSAIDRVFKLTWTTANIYAAYLISDEGGS